MSFEEYINKYTLPKSKNGITIFEDERKEKLRILCEENVDFLKSYIDFLEHVANRYNKDILISIYREMRHIEFASDYLLFERGAHKGTRQYNEIIIDGFKLKLGYTFFDKTGLKRLYYRDDSKKDEDLENVKSDKTEMKEAKKRKNNMYNISTLKNSDNNDSSNVDNISAEEWIGQQVVASKDVNLSCVSNYIESNILCLKEDRDLTHDEYLKKVKSTVFDNGEVLSDDDIAILGMLLDKRTKAEIKKTFDLSQTKLDIRLKKKIGRLLFPKEYAKYYNELDTDEKQICYKCREKKEPYEFRKDKRNIKRNGLSSWCRECENEDRRIKRERKNTNLNNTPDFLKEIF